MTATEVLRRMLDERGVEYVVDEEYGKKYPPEKRVTWSCDLAGEDMTVTAQDYCISIYDDGSADYFLDLDFHEVFTPEQAIAATLGSSNCMNSCTNSERTETCHDTGESRIFHCSECGLGLDDVYIDDEEYYSFADFPRFCPWCGAKVVEPTTNDVDAEVGA